MIDVKHFIAAQETFVYARVNSCVWQRGSHYCSTLDKIAYQKFVYKERRHFSWMKLFLREQHIGPGNGTQALNRAG
jgi:hypothetical protein